MLMKKRQSDVMNQLPSKQVNYERVGNIRISPRIKKRS